MPGQLFQQPLLFGLAQQILVMYFTRLLIKIHVRTHWIASILNALHDILLPCGFYIPGVIFIFKWEISVPVYLGVQSEQLCFLDTFWQPVFTFLIHGEWTADLEKALHGKAESAVGILW